MRLLAAWVFIMQVAAATPAWAGETSLSMGAMTVSTDEAFAQMSRLVGTWRPADEPQNTLRIRFYLTAGGTVLVESWEANGKPHSLTVYHRDGSDLLATHYCPQGNQPRLVLKGPDAAGLHFTFRDATDLEPAAESHQHDLWFDLSDPGHPVRSEAYRGDEGLGAPERLRLMPAGETSP